MREVREKFVAERKPRWQRMEQLLLQPFKGPKEWSELFFVYRAVCADLAKARSQRQPRDVVDYLDELAGRAHNAVYNVRETAGLGLVNTIVHEFPREVRAQLTLFMVAGLLFYGPFGVGFFGSLFSVDFAASVLPVESLQEMERNYAGDLSRGAGGDASMAGFYVWNNVGIAFRCFATGAFAGLGTLFYLAYNGLMIGTVAGYLAAQGVGLNLLTFTSGHSAWELTGVIVAGTAGLKLGWAILAPGEWTRIGAMRLAAPSLYRLIVGATVMLLIAALIEGFWSASPLPPPIKWLFGLFQCAIVATWLLLGGRGR